MIPFTQNSINHLKIGKYQQASNKIIKTEVWDWCDSQLVWKQPAWWTYFWVFPQQNEAVWYAISKIVCIYTAIYIYYQLKTKNIFVSGSKSEGPESVVPQFLKPEIKTFF